MVVDLQSLEDQDEDDLDDGNDGHGMKRQSRASSRRESEQSSRGNDGQNMKRQSRASSKRESDRSCTGMDHDSWKDEELGVSRPSRSSAFDSFAQDELNSRVSKSSFGSSSFAADACAPYMDSEEEATALAKRRSRSSAKDLRVNVEKVEDSRSQLGDDMATAQRRSRASTKASQVSAEKVEDYRMEQEDDENRNPLTRRRRPKGTTIRFSIAPNLEDVNNNTPRQRMSRRLQTQDLRNKLKYWQTREEEAPEGWIPAPANYDKCKRDGTMKRVTTIKARSHTMAFD